MSKSYKKNPIFGHASSSEKKDKRRANRKLRKKIKQSMNREFDILPYLREVSDVWGFAKDGKIYNINPKEEWMRK